MNTLKKFLPFLITLIIWRLAGAINPGGILALIPIFYYSFINPRPFFAPFAVIICFLIDYNLFTLFFWTFMYLLLYSVNCLQNYVDLSRQKWGGLLVFMCWVGLGLLILFLTKMSFANLWEMIWIFGLSVIGYWLLAKVMKK